MGNYEEKEYLTNGTEETLLVKPKHKIKEININGICFTLKKPDEGWFQHIVAKNTDFKNGMTYTSKMYESYLKTVVINPKYESLEEFEKEIDGGFNILIKLMRECEKIITN